MVLHLFLRRCVMKIQFEVEVKCPGCGLNHSVNVEREVITSNRDKDELGFVKGTKGSVIVELIRSKQKITVSKLLEALSKMEEYKADNNLGRVSSILRKLNKRGVIKYEGGVIEFLKSDSNKEEEKEVEAVTE